MRQSEKKNWRKKEKGLLNRYAEMTHPQIRADRQEASQREARVSASQQSIADVYCPHIKTWSVHLWVSVRRKWDDHETRPLAHATFILTLPHSHIDVGPREVKHRTTMSPVHHSLCPVFILSKLMATALCICGAWFSLCLCSARKAVEIWWTDLRILVWISIQGWDKAILHVVCLS